MANTINNVKDVGSIISKLAAGMLADKCQFIKSIDSEPLDSFGSTNGYSHGDTVNINKPARFSVGTNADLTSALQNVTEEKVALALDQRAAIGISLTSAEVATDLALKSWAKRILDPAMSSMAQNIESTVLTTAKNAVYNYVGDIDGTTVFDTALMLGARKKPVQNLAPMDDNMYALLNSTAMASAVDQRKGLFQSSEDIKSQYKNGYMGYVDGMTYLENNLLPSHTNGNDVTGAAIDDAAVATGASTIHIDGITTGTGTLKKGQVFTIAGVYAVHPITKVTRSDLQQFVVTADVTASGVSDADVSISPTIYGPTSGVLQNVSALPADDAAIVFFGAASSVIEQNLVYHKNAFRFVSVPLMKPSDSHMTAQETVDGMTVRVWQASDILTDKMILRLDVLYGFSAVRPEWACRIGY